VNHYFAAVMALVVSKDERAAVEPAKVAEVAEPAKAAASSPRSGRSKKPDPEVFDHCRTLFLDTKAS
jgi:hypothetical protein